ncbi:adenosylmethionine-8-amino-7-oxononanoate aminotransferase [Peteryoungia aggregata LMG 23059]|uniref:Adenosylmethionine-8-amino-7-oxononanoate aminotransferase n=1 Tax=Peteryoungia aggregata LMG 23059 TaxID=1368425 RepID=A0ABU0GES8_9HYPH|nr:adenosylmethionine-8-amino-7-oxononanoate aminotransferase [Peteryoungia aggregata LMG 23059]
MRPSPLKPSRHELTAIDVDGLPRDVAGQHRRGEEKVRADAVLRGATGDRMLFLPPLIISPAEIDLANLSSG